MKTPRASNSTCRHCRYYAHEGRRGGHCRQLAVDVQGSWKACALALPPFSPTWESFEEIMVWQQKALAAIEESTALAAPVGESLAEVDAVASSVPVSRSVIAPARSLRT